MVLLDTKVMTEWRNVGPDTIKKLEASMILESVKVKDLGSMKGNLGDQLCVHGDAKFNHIQ